MILRAGSLVLMGAGVLVHVLCAQGTAPKAAPSDYPAHVVAGDLTIAAQFVTPEAINFMAKEARGWICLALTPDRCEELGLELMMEG